MLGSCAPLLPMRSTRLLVTRIQPPTCISSYSTSCSSAVAKTAAIRIQQRQQVPLPGSLCQNYTRFLHPHFRATTINGSRFGCLLNHVRYASTTSQSSASTASTPRSSQSEDALTWNRFLALRKTRRRISQVMSVISAVLAMGAGVGVVTARDLDSLGAQTFGLDPFIMLGLSTIAFGASGWLIGPFFGNTLFGLMYRRLGNQIRMKEREFYARIKRFRVDPSSSSMANPVPDYYGEKIGSVVDYRRWLKDQRAFNLKRGRTV